MNLEAQVGHASDLFANRNINDTSSDGLNSNLCLKIDQLLEKLSNTSNAATNIVINSCQADRNAPTKSTVSTQTDQQMNLPNCICGTCGKNFVTNQQLNNHMENVHGQQSTSSPLIQPARTLSEAGHVEISLSSFVCEKCGESFETIHQLNVHLNSVHSQQSISSPLIQPARTLNEADNDEMSLSSCVCEKCGESFETVQQLNNHLNNVHEHQPTSKPLSQENQL